MKDYFKILIPNYVVNFVPGIEYSYTPYETKGKQNLKEALLESSKGYCMYCYRKVNIDGDIYSHLEHTIEQDTVQVLSKCHYNLSITCQTCNLSRKKKEQEKRRIIPSVAVNCDKNLCKINPCDDFFIVANEYIKNMISCDLEKIILRPRGIIDTKNPSNYYLIEFDLEKYCFSAYSNPNYEENVVNYIESHILKFDLNNPKTITKEIVNVIEDFLCTSIIPKSDRYNNYTAELFIELLNEMSIDKSIDEIKFFCDDIAGNLLLKGII